MSHFDHLLPVDSDMEFEEHHRVPPIRSASPRPPTPQELAAIAAAVEMAWPRAVIVTEEAEHRPPAWRFSGRWWMPRRPIAAGRVRP
jgi:hypothetical protein